jgi:hypothetical protein
MAPHGGDIGGRVYQVLLYIEKSTHQLCMHVLKYTYTQQYKKFAKHANGLELLLMVARARMRVMQKICQAWPPRRS